MLNFILFTNDKLFKIGFSDSDKCSFLGTCSEDCTTSYLTAPLCGHSGIDSQSGGLIFVVKIYL